jgi:diguanylate cyclase (GGDEF)-like protein
MANLEEQFQDIQKSEAERTSERERDKARIAELEGVVAALKTKLGIDSALPTESSAVLNEDEKALINHFVTLGDGPAVHSLMEHKLKYDAKLPTLLNSAAFRDEVLKMYRRQFTGRPGSVRRGADTHPGVAVPEGTISGPTGQGRLAILFIDLDDFKKLNDTRGHLAGDAALRAVAAVLSEGLRENDIKGRFGGEELVVALETENDRDHFLVAEKLRRLIEGLEIPYENSTLKVTASIGGAEHRAGESYEQLVDRANWTMKYAKANGKNRAVPNEIDDVGAWITAKKAVEEAKRSSQK